jgi:hypothetical protein
MILEKMLKVSLLSNPEKKEFREISQVSKENNEVVFWDVASCSLIDIGRRFRNVYCFNHQSPDDRDQTKLYRATFKKTVIFKPIAVRTLNIRTRYSARIANLQIEI